MVTFETVIQKVYTQNLRKQKISDLIRSIFSVKTRKKKKKKEKKI